MDRKGDPLGPTAKVPRLTRADSSLLEVREHPDLPAGAQIRLRPLITITAGRISGVEVSGRTPSPFGRAMGDHTVAWQALVDALHARLYGQEPRIAIGLLQNAQEGVSQWMGVPGSPGMLLLRELAEDIADRRPRLEDAASRVGTHLTAASAQLTGGNAAGVASALAKALACHLAYLNYLPFATVPAVSERGSHGSAEGHHRRKLVSWELERRKGRADEQSARDKAPTVTPEQQFAEGERRRLVTEATEVRRASVAVELNTTLWRLFDFTAAMREAHIEYVLNPGAADDLQAQVSLLAKLSDGLKVLAGELDPSSGYLTPEQRERLIVIEQTADNGKSSPYGDVSRAAGKIKDAATLFLGGQAETQLRTRLGVAAKAAKDAKVSAALTLAREAADSVTAAVKAAPARASRVLSALLRKHMRTVATAYPDSVRDSAFLGLAPAAAALTVLEAAIRQQYQPRGSVAENAIAKLRGDFGTDFDVTGIDIAASNEWVTDAGHEPLVITWNLAGAPDKFEINGRAEAPPGVAGMGSHTTAWITECMALNCLVAGARSDAEAVAALRTEVEHDLDGEVITLDRLLPADNLEGGQLVLMFAAVADALAATTPDLAARAFLRFRNLLPFATVDAGDRSGRGERKDATLADSYDRASLDVAAQLIAEAVREDDQHKRLAAALTAAAKELNVERTKEGANAWPEQVKTAAGKSSRRLSARSGILSKQHLIKGNDTRLAAIAEDASQSAEKIRSIRSAEHARVYDQAHPA